MKTAYHDFMREYLELGHMSLIPTPADDVSSYYLPHHPVFKASSTTTKVRVVFGGSAKTSSGFSLNDVSCVGPLVQDNLLDIILRFIGGADSVESARSLCIELAELLFKGGFELRKSARHQISWKYSPV